MHCRRSFDAIAVAPQAATWADWLVRAETAGITACSAAAETVDSALVLLGTASGHESIQSLLAPISLINRRDTPCLEELQGQWN